ELGHVNRLGFHFASVLSRLSHTLRERSHVPPARRILQDLSPIFGDAQTDLDIEDLPALVTGLCIISGRYRSPIDWNLFDDMGVVDLLKRSSFVSFLSAGLVLAFGFLFSMRIL